jgi:thiol-disulfide isomerase/thioredoxin
MNRTRFVVALASAVIAGAVVFGGAVVAEKRAGSDNGSAFAPSVPTFDLPNVHADGSRVSSAAFAGKPLVINVFDYTCVPCIRELPMLNASAQHNPDVAFVGIHLLLKRRDAAAFVDRLGIQFPVGYDGDGIFATAAMALPTTIFIGPDGVEVDRVTGAIAKADLEDRLERLRRAFQTAPQGIS